MMTRREALSALGVAAGLGVPGRRAQASDLPLMTPGLEHIGMTVPDQEATAKFYGRIFDPQLFQERDPPPRFYARAGISYIAFGGGNANNPGPPRIDHFCALVQDYKAQEMRKSLEAAGITMGNGPGGMASDPDGLRLQLLGTPGGLAKTIIPNTRVSQDPPAVLPIGFSYIVLAVSDMSKSAAFYEKVFGKPAPSRSDDGKWFTVGNTTLRLQRLASGAKPSIETVGIKVAAFDKKRIEQSLANLHVDVVPAKDGRLVRFKDPNGIVMELVPGV